MACIESLFAVWRITTNQGGRSGRWLIMESIIVKVPKEMKTALKMRAAFDNTSITRIVTELIASHLDMDIESVTKRATKTLPPKEYIESWYFEVRGQPVSVLDEWLKLHPFKDTSIPEIWRTCFKIQGKPKHNESIRIGNYLRRAGWSRTRNVVSSYRVNHDFGKARVYFLERPTSIEDELLV